MPEVKEVKVAAFNEVQMVEDGERIFITGDYKYDLARAVMEDHFCDDSACDIAAAIVGGFPAIAAYLLSGATECAHVDAVIWAYKFNGKLKPEQDPRRGMSYSLPEWEAWMSYFDTHSRQCQSCDAFNFFENSFELGPKSRCGNCGGELGYQEGDQVQWFAPYTPADPDGEGDYFYGTVVELKWEGERLKLHVQDNDNPDHIFWMGEDEVDDR